MNLVFFSFLLIYNVLHCVLYREEKSKLTHDAADDAGLGDWSKKREKMKTVPCLTNLSEDPQMNGRIIHFVDSVDNGETIFGRGDAVPKPDVILKGLNISKIQCVCSSK